MSNDVPALTIEGLRKGFPAPGGGRVEALDLPALELGQGSAMAVRGASGSGKTTLLDVVAGILRADEGRVEIMGSPMTGLGEAGRDALRARHIGYLFQTYNLLPHLTALENVMLGMSFRPRPEETPRQAARDALGRVDLADRASHRPHQLSVGQQQRVAMARALAGRPDLVLADEPTASLDEARAAAVLDLLLGFAAASEAALLVVTHDPAHVDRFDRYLVLEAPR